MYVQRNEAGTIIGRFFNLQPGFAEEWLDHGHPELLPAPQAVDVDIERDARIDAGFTFNGILFQSRAGDRENIAGAAQLAFMAMMDGAANGDLRWSDPSQDFTWIAADNRLVTMDAQTVVALGKAAAEHKQRLIFAARQIKDAAEIPADFAKNQFWPPQ